MITSLFAGFNHAVRSMMASQHALGVHGTNIANANNPNYTRRQLAPQSESEIGGPGVLRLRDAFVDDQYRLAAAVHGEAGIRSDVLSQAEDIFGDPVEGGLRKSIDQFFDAWQGLAENPGDGVARAQVLIEGRGFAQQIRSTYEKLTALEATVNEQLPTRVGEVNAKLERVFQLNKQIAAANRNNRDDADLRDQRDIALDDLAKLTGATAMEDADGAIRVVVGSSVVLDGPAVMKLTLVTTPDGPAPSWAGYGAYAPVFNGKGTISGLVSVRDGEIKQLKQEITSMATQVYGAVNAQHQAGVGLDGVSGRDFFTGTPPDIQVAALSVDHIAAGGAGGTGERSDGRNARLLVDLAEGSFIPSSVLPGNLESPRVFYRNLVGWLGSQAKETAMTGDMAKIHKETAETQRQAASGVSLDEEVALLQVQQRAFAASARIITVMDDLLDTLINRTAV